ncbi:MAG: tRNA (N6-threonylcarbamoyladenosine(37)-N6)-methyltransferase TrmO [Oscillospiraceae bacterium]|nr:tRNA (N6-threonylcarbamoyladenosine(37)-N6)-methyltransferase TrmO [Oscillospiraceae bacterium]
MSEHLIKPIAHIKSDFDEKFGIPRQSLVVPELRAEIVFEPEYRNPDFIKGLEGYTHIWLIWQFSENLRTEVKATVRPPRLGGDKRVGVFASRSPFRPNGLGLSCVRILEITEDPGIIVSGADLMNGTPIFDIKPYVPYSDRIEDAGEGYTAGQWKKIEVIIPDEVSAVFPAEKLTALKGVLENDPRPRFHDDPDRIYGMSFAGRNIRFKVSEGVLTVVDISGK